MFLDRVEDRCLRSDLLLDYPTNSIGRRVLCDVWKLDLVEKEAVADIFPQCRSYLYSDRIAALVLADRTEHFTEPLVVFGVNIGVPAGIKRDVATDCVSDTDRRRIGIFLPGFPQRADDDLLRAAIRKNNACRHRGRKHRTRNPVPARDDVAEIIQPDFLKHGFRFALDVERRERIALFTLAFELVDAGRQHDMTALEGLFGVLRQRSSDFLADGFRENLP